MSKKVIVLFHNEGQLANQLWLFFNLIAYALEKKYDIDIWCFYQYSKFFETPFPKNKLIKFLFYKTFPTFVFKNKNLFRIFRRLYRLIYKFLIILPIKILNNNKIIDSSLENIYLDDEYKKPEVIKKFEQDPNFNTVYTLEWNFLAFSLLRKHREQILEYFKPKGNFLNNIENNISKLGQNFDYLIGLHLRFKEPGDGEIIDENFLWYVNNDNLEYIKELINIFMKRKNLNQLKVGIFITSNAKNLNLEPFKGLNVFYNKRHFIEDLFSLAKCDVILGCKSSFCTLASYIGLKPIYFFTRRKDNFLNYLESNSSFKIWREI